MIVVDTNILVYRFVAGPRSSEADSLTRLAPEWAAPLLWRSEFRNVLGGYLRRGQLTRQLVETAMDEAHYALTAGEHQVKDSVVFDLIQGSRCSSYDCEFVALALAMKTTLVTEDQALLRSFPALCRSLAQTLAGA